jgi:hypothetical protein
MACIFGLGIVYLVVYVSTFGFFPRGNKPLKRVEMIQRTIAQNLKMGDSPDRVIQFLGAQNLEQSTLIKPEFMRMGGRNYGNQNVVAAIKRHTAGSYLWVEDIEIVFVFDEKHELAKFDVFPIYTSF